MSIQHPALIKGVESCANYLEFLGVRITPPRLKQIIERSPESVTVQKTDGGGVRYEWNPENLNATVRAITGVDLDLFLIQKKRDAARTKKIKADLPKRPRGRPRLVTTPEKFVTWASIVDGREIASRSTDDGAYEITWSTRRPYVSGNGVGGAECLVAYVMRGKLEPLKYRVTRLDLVGDGQWSMLGGDWAKAVSGVRADWPDAIFFVLSGRSPTALEALERNAG